MLFHDLLFTSADGEDTTKLPGTTLKLAKLPALDLANLVDNHAELREQWSFLQDTQNTWEVKGKR